MSGEGEKRSPCQNADTAGGMMDGVCVCVSEREREKGKGGGGVYVYLFRKQSD